MTAPSRILLLTVLCIATAACGGGSSSPPPPPTATHFSITGPANATAGVAFNVTVKALDASNNVVATYAGTVHFTSSDPHASLPGDTTLAGGMGSFSVTFETAGSQAITATDTVNSSITGSIISISVSPAPATHFSVTAPPNAIAGSAFNFTVAALDASNNVTTGYSGTIHFSSTDGQADLPVDSNLTNGTAAFPAGLNTAGQQTIKATDTLTASITGTSNSINVSAAAAVNPVPLINQPLAPEAVAPGGAGFTLTVNGTGFVQGSKVNWNGSSRSTTFVSASKLTASILASDIANSSVASIAAVSPGLRGGTSNPVFFDVSNPASSIGLGKADFAAGSGADSIGVGDFNGDGMPDLAVANFNDNTVTIFLGNGDGTFKPGVNYPTQQAPDSVIVRDFNGDGKLDIAVRNVNSNTVSVLLGNGDGTFQAATNFATGQAPSREVAADFNADGFLDLAVTNGNDSTVSILLGNGDGTFQTHLDYETGSGPVGVATGDLNGDGKLDLVVANGGAENVSVLLGNGDGTLQPHVEYATVSSPQYVAVADFNGDGKLDLAVAGANNVSVLLGNGDGTFQPHVDYATGGGTFMVTAADFNGDGRLDLAAANRNDGTVSILLGNGDGTFQNAKNFTAGSGALYIAMADFNGDGKLDLAVANVNDNTVSIMLQVPTATLTPANLNLGNQLVGTTSAAQQVTLTNSSGLPLKIGGIAISGTNASDFGETTTCGSSLTPGTACTINVAFTPSQIGPRTASLTVTDNAADSPQSVALTGAGLVSGPNATLSPTTLSFATQLVSTASSAQAVNLTNFGTAALNISGITASSNFSQTNNCPASLASGASCTINVSFMPTTAGSLNGSISVADNAPGTPQTVGLSGIGTFVELNPSSLNFGSVAINSTHTLTTTLTNTGGTTLTITSISITGAGVFSQTNTCGGSVAAKSSCSINVTFLPKSGGNFFGQLVVTDSDPGSPQQVSLHGTTRKTRINAAAIRPSLSAQKTSTVPAPTGPERVGTSVMDFVDTSRSDPYLANGAKRELLVRFWYPATVNQDCVLANYTSPAVWRRFSQLLGVPLPEVSTSSCLDAAVGGGLHPVVVFTHGYTGTFTDYTFLFEDLASRGYVVASVDHTYEATAVEFPDGRVATSVLGSYLSENWQTADSTLQFAVSVRLDDLRFVLNELTQMNGDASGPFAGRLDMSRVALAGHSLGGLTTLLGVQQDTRFQAGILLDPYLPEDVSVPTLTPVFLLAAGRTAWTENERSLWHNLQGSRLAVNLRETEHVTPSDAVWLAKGAVQTGPMGQEKVIAAMRNYIAAFLDANLRGDPKDPLLTGLSPSYPEAVVTTQNESLR